MARSMLSLGMFSALAARIACRRREFPSGSPPPSLAARLISLAILVKILPFLASAAPFFRLMVLHFECPDMRNLPNLSESEAKYHRHKSCQHKKPLLVSKK